MKTKIRLPLLSVGFGLVTVCGLVGTISGSIAWWAYSTRVSVAYQGTSVASSEQLQIGIKTDIDMTGFGMTQVGDYYFADPGAGLPAGTIAHYLTELGTFGVDKLEPVTSNQYETGGTFSLKASLVAGHAHNYSAAPQSKYVKIPFAFRIVRYNASNVLDYSKGENIWLSDTMVEASTVDDGNVYKAIRMYTEGKINNSGSLVDQKLLINPSSEESTMGKTPVAGLLNLSGGNTYFDTKTVGDKKYALVYGETEYTDEELIGIETTQQSADADSDWVDFNNTEYSTAAPFGGTTFLAKYEKGVYHPANQAAIKPLYANYDTLGSVRPTDDNGVLSEGKPLCATDLTTAIADLDMTIWLEGWDHNVIDQENEHSFNLGLQFQISTL